MDQRRVAEIYHEYVVAPGLERLALLELLRSLLDRPPAVLYPGSFIHLAPSFFFQHVIYVDRSDFARRFFAQTEAVLQIANERRRYRQRPFIRFCAQCFTAELPAPRASFDLLLALYTGGVSRACTPYLRPGGLLVTNDHHGDARDAAALGLTLEAVVEEHRSEVRLRTGDLTGYLEPRKEGRRAGRSTTPGPQYVREAACYIFRKPRR